MVFMKKGEALRRQKVKKANVARKEENAKRKNADQGIIAPVGKRMFDLSKLATDMWCSRCDAPLSFRFLESEQQYGLASVFKVRCFKCLELYEITSSSTASTQDVSQQGRRIHSVNLNLAFGCIDAGIGHDQLNKLLSTVNLPTMDRKTFEIAEKRVGPCIVDVAEGFCVEAIAEEKVLSIKRRRSMSTTEMENKEKCTCDN